MKTDLDQVKREIGAKIDANTAKIDTVARKLTNVEQRLTAKIDANAVKIDANATKIDTVARRLTNVEQRLTAKIDANAVKIDSNSAKIDRLIQQVIENSVRLDQMATREELNRRFDELVTGMDKMMTILLRRDQERVTTNVRLDRVERVVEELKAGKG